MQMQILLQIGIAEFNLMFDTTEYRFIYFQLKA